MAAARKKDEAEAVEVTEVTEVVETSSGPGMEVALIVFTTLALVVAIIVGFTELGHHYGAGPMKQ